MAYHANGGRVFRQGFARDMARRLLKRSSITRPPVPVEEIVHRELQGQGVKIFRVNDWKPDTCGLVYKLPGCLYIGVNGQHYAHRQRFTLAHELGHIALAHEQRTFEHCPALLWTPDMAVQLPEEIQEEEAERQEWEKAAGFWDLGNIEEGLSRIPSEQEANAFAGEMLMPRAWLKRDWPKYSSLEALSRLYQVSPAALTRHLCDHNLL